MKRTIKNPLPRVLTVMLIGLADDKSPQRYSEDKAFNGDPSTAWVEGVEGPGLGEQVAFEIAPRSTRIEIYPGYGVEEYHRLDNRVKSAVPTLYEFKFLIPHTGVAYRVEKVASRKLLCGDQPFPTDRLGEALPTSFSERLLRA